MTRRKANNGLLSAVLLILLLVAAACGLEQGELTGGAGNAAVETDTVHAAAAEPEQQAEPEHRIVSTTVAITEIMDALELDLAGIPKTVKMLPSRYDGIMEVGNPMSPDMELVKSLRPTEVLSVTTLQYELEPVFENINLDATFLDLTSLADMQAAIEDLGARYDREAQAADIVQKLDRRVADIREAASGREQPTVLILLGVPGSYLVATEHSYIGDLVRLLGGINIVQGESVEYLASNTEYLQQASPDVILRAAHGMPEEVVKMFDKEFKTNDIWKHFSAVQTGRVYDLEEALFPTTANLAADRALEALAEMLYP